MTPRPHIKLAGRGLSGLLDAAMKHWDALSTAQKGMMIGGGLGLGAAVPMVAAGAPAPLAPLAPATGALLGYGAGSRMARALQTAADGPWSPEHIPVNPELVQTLRRFAEPAQVVMEDPASHMASLADYSDVVHTLYNHQMLPPGAALPLRTGDVLADPITRRKPPMRRRGPNLTPEDRAFNDMVAAQDIAHFMAGNEPTSLDTFSVFLREIGGTDGELYGKPTDIGLEKYFGRQAEQLSAQTGIPVDDLPADQVMSELLRASTRGKHPGESPAVEMLRQRGLTAGQVLALDPADPLAPSLHNSAPAHLAAYTGGRAEDIGMVGRWFEAYQRDAPLMAELTALKASTLGQGVRGILTKQKVEPALRQLEEADHAIGTARRFIGLDPMAPVTQKQAAFPLIDAFDVPDRPVQRQKRAFISPYEDSETLQDVALSASTGAGGAAAVAKGWDQAIGNRRLYHGVYDPDVEAKVRASGLDPAFAGTGFTTGLGDNMQQLVSDPAMRGVYLSDTAPAARFYASVDPVDMTAATPEYHRALTGAHIRAALDEHLTGDNARGVLEVNMPEYRFQQLQADPTSPLSPGSYKAPFKIAPEDIDAHALRRALNRAGELGQSFKANPARMLGGLAQVGGGLGLMAYSGGSIAKTLFGREPAWYERPFR